jgi:fluoride exporter
VTDAVTPRAAVRRPAEPDLDIPVPRRRRTPLRSLRRAPWTVLAAISAGGVLGALARHGLIVVFPYAPGTFPWATFAVNATGCLLIGLLMVAITETGPVHRLVRPFLGVGVLGGFTTFSTYIVDTQRAVTAGAAGTGLAYLVATPVAALVAVYAGSRLARLVIHRLRRAEQADRAGRSERTCRSGRMDRAERTGRSEQAGREAR